MNVKTVGKKTVALLLAAVFAIGTIALGGQSLIARAANYNASAAVNYANTYVYNYNSNYTSYKGNGGDCANFVSQCLYAGGLQSDSTWKPNSYAWINVWGLYSYLSTNHSVRYSTAEAEVGDVVIYKNSSATYGHATICIESGSKVASHTTDGIFNINYMTLTCVIKMNGTPTSTHTVDTNYPKNFTAYLKDPNTDHRLYTAYDTLHATAYINGPEPVTIHEVYTDGCCYITYELTGGGTNTGYAKISWFSWVTHDDFGADFYAYLGNQGTYQWITNVNNNVKGAGSVGSNDQIWHFYRTDDGSYYIVSCSNSYTIDVADWGSSAGTNLQCMPLVKNGAQRFWIQSYNGGYRFRCYYTNLVFEVASSGYNISLQNPSTSKNQVFNIQKCGYTGITKAPTASLAVNKTSIKVQDSLTLTFSGNNTSCYTLNIYKDEKMLNAITVNSPSRTYTKAFSEAGSYKAIMRAYSAAGYCDSNWVYWTVTDPLTAIQIKTKPSKLSYYVGDTLNTAGLTLTATYDSGKTETVSSGFTCTPTALNTAGTQTITVTYGGKTATFNITVVADAVKSVSIKTQPTKTSYYVGDTLNTAGLTLTATYDSGKTEVVSSGFTCTPTALNTAGTQTITVTYGGKTATFNVTVLSLLTYTISNGQVTITDCDSSVAGVLEIPAVIEGCPVTAIGARAFSECTELASIIIPDSVTSIGDSAFYGCTGLMSVTLPDSVTSIGEFVFEYCTGLTNVVLPSGVTSIKSGTFSGCSEITSITIPDSVTNIGSFAFYECSGLKNITIPNGVKSIDGYAFYGCTGLTSIEIPDSVTSIGTSAFTGCTGLTDITLSNSITSIESYMFDGCTNLTKIVIPDGVTSIDTYAFNNCGKLASVTIPASVTSIGEYAFRDCTGLTDVYYEGSKEMWDAVTIEAGNDDLVQASLHCNVFTLTYSANGGTGAPANQAGKGALVLSTVKPTRSGYTFLGWATSSTATAAQYQPGALFDLTKDTTLYAQWEAVTLTKIAVKSLPTKTKYYIGETLNTTGLTLTATYSDGSTKTISSGFTCTPTKLNTVGTQTITVTYGGKTATFNVTVVADAVKSVSIKTQPTKTSYYVGDTLNTAGLTLTATYNSGKTETVSSGFTCTPTALKAAGTQTITVTYGGKTTTFNVTVVADAVKSIAIKTQPTKTSYYVGDTLNIAGLTLTATYNSGKTETVSSGFTCTPTGLSKAGTQTITVTYGGKTASFTVTVVADAVKSVAIKTKPSKLSYYVGDTLNTAGMTLTATYDSGKTETVSSGFTCTPMTLSAIGQQNITVTYAGQSAAFAVTVAADAVKSIAIKTKPSKLNYYVGDTLNTDGMTLTATYDSGKTETVSSGFTCTPMTLNTIGQQNITVTYAGQSAAFAVTVAAKPVASRSVTFLVDGEVYHTASFEVGAAIQQPTVPVKAGYRFRAWSPALPAVMPDRDLTVSAVFDAETYTALFIADGVTIAAVPYTVNDAAVAAPAIPEKAGYDGKWSDYTLTAGGVTVYAVYTAKTFVVPLIVDGKQIGEVTYTYGDTALDLPPVPEKDGYDGKWDYTLSASGADVKAVYTPITYYAVFMADGVEVGRLPYTVETAGVTPPAVPVKANYDGAWAPYTLAIGGVTVNAVYTPKSDPPAPVNPTISIRNFTNTRTVDYKTSITFAAVTANAPAGAQVHWFIDGRDAGASETYTVDRATANYTVQCKLIGANGAVLAESGVETVKVNTGFFAKLIAFLRGIFGTLPVITQAIRRTL